MGAKRPSQLDFAVPFSIHRGFMFGVYNYHRESAGEWESLNSAKECDIGNPQIR
jgi:hypothetical protein